MRTQVNVLLTVVLEAQSSLELVDLITNKCVPFGKTARTAGTYRKQMQPVFTATEVEVMTSNVSGLGELPSSPEKLPLLHRMGVCSLRRCFVLIRQEADISTLN